MRKRLQQAVGLLLLALLTVACAARDNPNGQNSLDPKGPYAETIDGLFTPVFWIAVGVFVIVEGLILWFCIRYRHRKGRSQIPPQIHGNTRLEIGWTILPAVVLVVIAVPTVATLWDLAAKPAGDDVINVTVKCHQWWWEFDYTDPEFSPAEGQSLITANELVIPEDTPVYVSLETVGGLIGPPNPDHQVLHSFHVPELAGTQDCVPGRTNHLNLEAGQPGLYRGACFEFCGLSHANMRFSVIAKTAGDFDAWVTEQKADAVAPADGSLASKGLDLFGQLPGGRGNCVACHAIQGVEGAGGIAGPNLTHFASRDCFAGCIFQNGDTEQLRAWLRDPAAVKPGSKMPNYGLTESEIDAFVAYLESLE